MTFSARSGVLGYDLARDVLIDPRLRKLSLRSIGAFFLIKAHDEAMQPIESSVMTASRALRVTSRTYSAIMDELSAAAGSPLVIEVDGSLRANPFGQPIKSSVQNVRRLAAKARWNAVKEAPKAQAKTSKKKGGRKEVAPDTDDVPAPVAPAASVIAPASQPDLFLMDEPGKIIVPPPIEDKSAPVPYTKLAEIFNKTCTGLPKLKRPNDWTIKRKQDLAVRWKSYPSFEWWTAFFQRVHDSDFLCGRAKSFKASFDWIIGASNFLKINEGNFDNRSGSGEKRSLFNGGGNQFKVGSYGAHEVGDVMPWEVPNESGTGNGGMA